MATIVQRRLLLEQPLSLLASKCRICDDESKEHRHMTWRSEWHGSA